MLSELPPRGTGLILGTARRGLERGLGRPLTEAGRRERHRLIYGQKIPHPLREKILQKFPELYQYPLIRRILEGFF